MTDRIAMLQQILAEHPKEVMPRYSLALEYANAGNSEAALNEFATLLRDHPDYTPGYQMAAQTLMSLQRMEEAKGMLQQGIACAERAGNAHARSEMEGMLNELG